MRIHLILLASTMLAACSDGYDAPPHPGSRALAEAGAALFSDSRLGADGNTNCASCHSPTQAFSDGRRVSIGVGGREGTRDRKSVV